MDCIKCGRETRGEDIFCQECLAEMEKYPVQPGTVVLLPRRRDSSAAKKSVKRHTPSSEELIENLRRQKALLLFLLIVCVTAIVLMFEPTMHYIRDEHYEIGQNYSSVTTDTPTEPE